MTPPLPRPLKAISMATVLIVTLVSTGVHAGPLLDKWRQNRETRTAQAGDQQSSQAESGPGEAVISPDVKVMHDLAYGQDPRQRMDVYLPARQPALGVVFMVHGGAWRVGDKAASNVVTHKVQRWLPKGMAMVSVNYRMLPNAPVETQANDVRAALAYAQQHAANWGLPEDRWVLMGHSAGAHLVALVSADPALAHGARRWLGTVVLDSAVMNVPEYMAHRHARLYDEAFGNNPSAWPLNSPAHHLTAQAAPMLLVCSTQRPDAPCRQAQDLARQAQALGVRMQVLPQAKSHGEINDQLGLAGPYTEAVEQFLGSLHPAWANALK